MSSYNHQVIWLTKRSERHCQAVLDSAPYELDVKILTELDPDNLPDALEETDFIVSERTGMLTADVFSAAPKLRLVVRLGSLSYDIDLAAAKAAGVLVSRQPVVGAIMAAEHCLMMILALLKQLNSAQALVQVPHTDIKSVATDENTFSYNWAGLATVQGLLGKKVAIIGMGEIGVELCRRLRPFQPATIFYHKRNRYPKTIETELSITYADLPTCYSNADVFVFLLPYSPETRMMVGAPAFFQMPRGSVVVHVGSGGTLDEAALERALRIGHLGGAALDAFTYEPIPHDHGLIALAKELTGNVILTPHIASATLSPNVSSRLRDFDEIMRFLWGEPLRFELKL